MLGATSEEQGETDASSGQGKDRTAKPSILQRMQSSVLGSMRKSDIPGSDSESAKRASAAAANKGIESNTRVQPGRAQGVEGAHTADEHGPLRIKRTMLG